MQKGQFTFADLFAGIGGIRIGLEKCGGVCLYSVEKDKYARKTYKAWFGSEPEWERIEDVDPKAIPYVDVLAAGFPCQPFSIAGVSKLKSLGRPHGLRDQGRGVLFLEVLRLALEGPRPPIVLIENVKNLLTHVDEKTGVKAWDVLKAEFEKNGYKLHWAVLDGHRWVPQHRERLVVVALDTRRFGKKTTISFPNTQKLCSKTLETILDPSPGKKYTLGTGIWACLQRHRARHEKAGHGFGYRLVDITGHAPTLTARYYKDGSEILIPNTPRPRRLTPVECGRLMGMGTRKIVVSDLQAYKQFGNAVVPAMIQAVGRALLPLLRQIKRGKKTRGNKRP